MLNLYLAINREFHYRLLGQKAYADVLLVDKLWYLTRYVEYRINQI